MPGYSNCRMAVHVTDSYRRMQLVYGFPEGLKGQQLVRWWKERLDAYQPVPAEVVHTGPVMQNVREGDAVDLLRFPAPVWHQHDVGPYLATGGAAVLRDPDTGRLKFGGYRGMLDD